MINEVKAFEVVIGPERLGWIVEVPEEVGYGKPHWAAIVTLPKLHNRGDLLGIFDTSHKAHEALLKHEGIEKINVEGGEST
jgi:hypothetical protein